MSHDQINDRAAATKQPPEDDLIESLIQTYGYRSYDMIPTGKVSADGWHESVPGPTKYSFKFHPLIERVISVLRRAALAAPDRASMPEPGKGGTA